MGNTSLHTPQAALEGTVQDHVGGCPEKSAAILFSENAFNGLHQLGPALQAAWSLLESKAGYK